jgi:hypothetical protein
MRVLMLAGMAPAKHDWAKHDAAPIHHQQSQ